MLMQLLRNKQKGFTLIEILVVIGILAVLLAIVLIAINPQQQFQQANDTQRRSDVNAILNAVSSYAAQNKGQLPEGDGDVEISTTTAQTISSAGGVNDIDLCDALVPDYIADLPLDPTDGSETPAASVCTTALAEYNTGYTILRAGNRVTVSAPGVEGTDPITVTR
jgi:prepilin-type N-terminal cleavage/methylation domain-containing protein